MTTTDDSAFFEEQGYKLDAMIMTSFTEFDEKRVNNYLKKASSFIRFDRNRMWLFQCNPVMKQDNSDKQKSLVYRRIFKPNCKKNGKTLTCEKCLENCINGGKGIPEKVFHPKVWLLRFVSKEGANKGDDLVWKLIVSSKNMSKGAEKLADCFFYTKGRIGNRIQNNDLTRMLDELRSEEGSQGKLAWDNFIELLAEIKTLTWEHTPEFLYVNGQNWHEISNKLPWSNNDVEDMMVLSPFLNGEFVSYLYKVCPDTKIYSRKDTGFSSLSPSLFCKYQKNMFDLKFAAGEKEIDWHAKIFVWKMNGKWYMLLGSLNATKKAFTDNTEFGVWFEIEESQVPGWTGETPILAGGDEKDEAFDRKIEEVFKETEAEEISPTEQQIYKEKLRKELIEEAKEKILKCTESGEDKETCKDFESALLCKKEELNLEETEAKIKEINEKYDELNDDKVWRQYIDGCLDLIEAIKKL